jgi:hypothetical protein
MGVGRRLPVNASVYAWYNQASKTDGEHQIKVFDENGKFLGPFSSESLTLDQRVGINVQAWGHMLALISIRSQQDPLQVILQSSGSFDAGTAEVTSVHFGPKAASPVGHRIERLNGHTSLILQFRLSDTGIRSGDVNACLSGRQRDGVPFEGCDLLKNSGR